MASKKQHEIFNNKVHKLLIRLGATEPGKLSYKYQLETKAGLLFITTHEPAKSDIFSVFCKFESPGKAKEIVSNNTHESLNPYSGKWNYHQTDSDYLIDRLEANLKNIVLIAVNNT
jgi:hypothetical protein